MESHTVLHELRELEEVVIAEVGATGGDRDERIRRYQAGPLEW
jgi:hypothetical protein